MTYAYLFKYIIIGDTGNPGRQPSSWGGDSKHRNRVLGAGLIQWAGRLSEAGAGRAAGGGARGSGLGVLGSPLPFPSPGCPDTGLYPGGVTPRTRVLFFQVWGSHVCSCSLQTRGSSLSTTSQ